MIVHIDDLDKVRKDLVVTLQVEDDRLKVYVDQQSPPCGDFNCVTTATIPLPKELTDEQIWLLRT